jgi:hypothetical protein
MIETMAHEVVRLAIEARVFFADECNFFGKIRVLHAVALK